MPAGATEEMIIIPPPLSLSLPTLSFTLLYLPISPCSHPVILPISPHYDYVLTGATEEMIKSAASQIDELVRKVQDLTTEKESSRVAYAALQTQLTEEQQRGTEAEANLTATFSQKIQEQSLRIVALEAEKSRLDAFIQVTPLAAVLYITPNTSYQ